MPGKDGMEVAREILDLKLDQRIIFAYVMFKRRQNLDTIEDKEVYQELKKIMMNIRVFE